MKNNKLQIVKLKDIVDVLNGYAFKSSKYVNSGYRVMRITNVQKGTLVDNDPKYYEQSDDLDRYELKVGDILISLTGNVGRVGLVEESILPAYLNQRVGCLRIKSDEVCNEYLFHWLNNDSFEDNCIRNSNGIAQLNMSSEWLKDVEIQLPSLDEQKKIAKILDKADEIRAKKKLANNKLDEFLKSTFISMFGDSKGNPNGFELKELQTISNVGSSKRVFVNELVEKGIPFYRGTEIGALAEGKEILPELFITEEHYKELCDCTGKVNQGDLLLPSICPDGRIWQVQDNAEFYFKDGRVLWIRPNAGENSTYIRYALKELFQSDYKHIASGTTFAELKIFILKTLNIMYPPMELQNKFAQIVEHVEVQKQKNELVIEQMNNLFNSLSQRAFKGEL